MILNFNEIVNEYKEKLQQKEITDITRHKIKYIKEYTSNWIYINCESSNCNTIIFIDCMCNAGVYIDGTPTTSIEVLSEFIVASKKYPGKKFYLLLNDFDTGRTEVIKLITDQMLRQEHGNIKIIVDNLDVNEYINSLNTKYKDLFQFGSNTLLFVDPYNFGTVSLNVLLNFVEKNYCELIYNYFSSDYRRNLNNVYALDKQESIVNSLHGIDDYSEEMNEKELMQLICDKLKSGSISYTFSYQFRTKTNVPLYSIIFATRHWRGLEEIKNAYWKIFDGNPFFQNNDFVGEINQLSLFSDIELNEDYYLKEAEDLLVSNFCNQEIPYKQIQIFLLENTMLKTGQITSKLLKPLVKKGKMKKLNYNGLKDYRNDSFIIIGDKNV